MASLPRLIRLAGGIADYRFAWERDATTGQSEKLSCFLPHFHYSKCGGITAGVSAVIRDLGLGLRTMDLGI
jgi:hypothetical protein